MGPGVKQGFRNTKYTSNIDFAPTALNALGLDPGEFMTGRIVEEIYLKKQLNRIDKVYSKKHYCNNS